MSEIEETNEGDGDKPSPTFLRRYDDKKYSPHAIHMVRTTATNTMLLSQMADQKASILMGATFVVFSITVGQAAAGNYRGSLLVLAMFAFISAMIAVSAVVPQTKSKPPQGQIPNLLFFGVFAQIEEEEFIDVGMGAAEQDGRVLSSMLRDIHQNGLVLLNKKYRLLSLSFRTFQLGLTLTFLMFLYESRYLFPGLSE